MHKLCICVIKFDGFNNKSDLLNFRYSALLMHFASIKLNCLHKSLVRMTVKCLISISGIMNKTFIVLFNILSDLVCTQCVLSLEQQGYSKLITFCFQIIKMYNSKIFYLRFL